MSDVRLSVIIPAFNAATHLKRCLESVLDKGLEELEVVVVNDGSVDETRSILEKFQRRFEALVVVEQPNRGLSGARNTGMAVASGRYCVFLDADDELDVRAIWRTILPAAEDADLDIAFFNTEPFALAPEDSDTVARLAHYYSRSPKLPAGPVNPSDLLGKMASMQSYLPSACFYLWKRAHAVKSGICFREGEIREDNAFTFGILSTADSVGYFPVTVHKRLVRRDSLSQTWGERELARGYLWAYIDACFYLETEYKNLRKWQTQVLHRLRHQVTRRAGSLPLDTLSQVI